MDVCKKLLDAGIGFPLPKCGEYNKFMMPLLYIPSVITRILSANGYKNPASSKHPLVHSWTKNAFPKGPKLYNQL
jgi:hypothetical protein